MSTSGKMSVGVQTIISTPRIATSIDATTNVYGRRRARRTIHIRLTRVRLRFFGRSKDVEQDFHRGDDRATLVLRKMSDLLRQPLLRRAVRFRLHVFSLRGQHERELPAVVDTL